MASISHRGFIHLGLDVSRDSISVAVLEPNRDVAVLEKRVRGALRRKGFCVADMSPTRACGPPGRSAPGTLLAERTSDLFAKPRVLGPELGDLIPGGVEPLAERVAAGPLVCGCRGGRLTLGWTQPDDRGA